MKMAGLKHKLEISYLRSRRPLLHK